MRRHREGALGSATATTDPGKLARSATGVPVVPVFDGFRGVAVMAIVFLHLVTSSGLRGQLPDGVGTDMALGLLPRMIDVLFIVSGFVLFMPTVVRAGRFGDVLGYAVRRAARILPTYYLVLAVVMLLVLTVPQIGIPAPSALDLGLHLTMLQSPAKLFDGAFPIGLGLDGALWTISVLVCFYVLLPLIAKPYYRHPLIGLALAGAITIAWREGVNLSVTGSTVQLPYWTWHLGLGMTAAWAYLRLRERGSGLRVRRWAPFIQVATLAGMAFVLYLRPAPFEGDLLAGIAASSRSLPVAIAFPALLTAFMLATADAPPRARAWLDSRPARRLGDASYGIYMIHLPILVLVVSLGLLPPPLSAWRIVVELALVVPPSLIFGWLAFRYVETPVRERARAWAHRRQAEDATKTPPSGRRESRLPPVRRLSHESLDLDQS